MTEGIIQEVFGRYYQLTAREREIQQELIEKIRKDLEKIDYREMKNLPRLELLGEIWVKLIGDSKK